MQLHYFFSIIENSTFDILTMLAYFRNPKDACVSLFHMEKLMPNMKLRQDYDFEDYAMKFWMKDKTVYGSYWEHINVCI